ncbi:sensor histidine kinase [Bacillus coreaensis]
MKQLSDLDMLQEIQDRFAEATGLAAITVDYSGKPITKYSKFSSFCAYLREFPEYREKCYQCDAFGGLEAARRKKPYIYQCHSGLIDFAIPIIANEQYLGSILAGQTRLDEISVYKLDSIGRKSEWEKHEKAKEAFEDIPLIPFEKVSAAAEMMFLVVNNLVEQNITSLIQNELNEKNTKLIQEMQLREQLEMELQRKDIQSQQLQMNPYFLFGILNTASNLSILEDATKTGELIFSLTEFTRYLLDNINSLVTLEEELTHVENYLAMQAIRFEDRITYEINVPDQMKTSKIPAVIIQSIVDNAVIHGLEPKEWGGRVTITGSSQGGQWIIEVSDNGVGIPEHMINNLLSFKDETHSERQSKGIGLSVVNQILISHYGLEHSMAIKSIREVGTTVTIKVPKQMGRLMYA